MKRERRRDRMREYHPIFLSKIPKIKSTTQTLHEDEMGTLELRRNV